MRPPAPPWRRTPTPSTPSSAPTAGISPSSAGPRTSSPERSRIRTTAPRAYLYDRVTGARTLLSHPRSSPLTAVSVSEALAMSSDGRYIALAIDAGDLDPDAPSNGDPALYVYDRVTGAYQRIASASYNFRQEVALSADGRILAFAGRDGLLPGVGPGLYLYDRVTKSLSFAARTELADGRLALSGDGRYAAFTSETPGLVPGLTRTPGLGWHRHLPLRPGRRHHEPDRSMAGLGRDRDRGSPTARCSVPTASGSPSPVASTSWPGTTTGSPTPTSSASPARPARRPGDRSPLHPLRQPPPRGRPGAPLQRRAGRQGRRRLRRAGHGKEGHRQGDRLPGHGQGERALLSGRPRGPRPPASSASPAGRAGAPPSTSPWRRTAPAPSPCSPSWGATAPWE